MVAANLRRFPATRWMVEDGVQAGLRPGSPPPAHAAGLVPSLAVAGPAPAQLSADRTGERFVFASSSSVYGDAEALLAAAGLGEIAAPAHPEAAAGSRGALALRPEHLRISAHTEQATLKNHFVGTVREYLYLGDVTVYKVRLDNGVTLEALTTNAAPGKARFHEIGDRVSVEWRHDAGVFLRA